MSDLHERWPHRWLSPKAEARPSPIQGTGVFAQEKIPKGEIVGVLGGVIVHKNDIQEYWNRMDHVGIQIDADFFIVPTTREELETQGVFNHSCQPNIGFSSSTAFVSMRDIESGEELVFDYAFCETAHPGFACHCQASVCRKKVTSTDWQLKKIQEKHGQFFSPYLRNKIR